MVLRVGVLGPVTAWYGDQELPVGQPRQQAVLGILAMRANRVISRGELVDAVWGQDPPASAEGGIYTYVAGLRRIIEPNRSLRGPGRVLVSAGAGYVLHLVPGQPDAVSFEQYLGRARQLRKSGDPAGAVAALNSALGLWRGIAFAGVPGPFAETERVRLGELGSAAAEERADVLLTLGRREEVVPDLTAMVANHPLRERMRGLLMIALYRSGRHAESLRVFAGRQARAGRGTRYRSWQRAVPHPPADPHLRSGAEPGRRRSGRGRADEFERGRPHLGDGRRGGIGGEAAGPGPPRRPNRPRPSRAWSFPCRPSCRSRHPASPVAMTSSACCRPRCPRDPSGPTSRCRWSSSRARRGSARRHSPSASAARSPSAFPTASCTPTCAAWVRPRRRWNRRGAAVLPGRPGIGPAPDPGRHRGTGSALPQPARRQAHADRARQRAQHGSGTPAAAGFTRLPGRGHQP